MTEEEKIAAAIAEALKPIKASLDASYAERDAARLERDALKASTQAALDEANAKIAADKEAHDKALEEKAKAEGDFKALHALEVAATATKLTKAEEALRAATQAASEASTKVAELSKQNSELARDNSIGVHLKGVVFANDTAAAIAVSQLARDMVFTDNVWFHKSGSTLAESVKAFLDSEDNAFLLKQTNSSGSGTDRTKSSPGAPGTLTTAAILELARKGKLPLRR
jgi:hypothetical protein